jgi:hypothetical protein
MKKAVQSLQCLRSLYLSNVTAVLSQLQYNGYAVAEIY